MVQFHLKIILTKDEENLKDDIADTAIVACVLTIENQRNLKLGNWNKPLK